MEMIIGRDPATSRLKVIIGQKPYVAGEQGSVPMTVSRQHCSITPQDGGKYLVKNLKDVNTTYVNGMPIAKKVVTEADKIELGEDHYLLSWDVLKKVMPAAEKEVDIRPLKKVWDNYDNFRLNQQITERKFNNQRQTLGLLTMGAIILGYVTGRALMWSLPFYAVAISLGAYFSYKAHKKASAIPKQNKEAEKKLMSNYVCPSCGHFMGMQPYDVLRQNNACPYCKAKFKQK